MTKKKIKPHFGILSIILLVIIAVLIVADLLTKHFEVEYKWNAVIIPHVVEIDSGHKNWGIAFGIPIGSIPVLIITFILLAAMIFSFIVLPNRYVLLKVAISLVIAGAIGNIVDRIALGYVRDWFGLWMFGGMTYCNFADFFIVIGAILAAVDMLFINEIAVFPLTKKAKAFQAARKEEEERKKAEAASTDSVSVEDEIKEDKTEEDK
ncbi:MAG: signal peptidase II [Clostridia bacterium]|nr:signal peptidase II [Clostridia bacterium]